MASLISANIDLTKIDKSKIYEGKKGKYYPITIVLNDESVSYTHLTLPTNREV